ncbi:MAG: TIGR03943 family protein [Clostridiaceae bacterium]|nr:TIGR03943 family protein [Clostridiaceae bacterium]
MVKFNKSELKWQLILIGLTYYLYMLLSTRRIYYFIHPRMIKYTYLSFIFLIILTLLQLKRLFTISENRKISFSIFFIPIILGLLVDPQGLSGEIAGKKKLSLSQNNIAKSNSPSNKENVTILKIDNENSLLEVNNNNFIDITDGVMNTNTDKYIGQKINITGFVYRDETTSKNEFIVGRIMIICCAADSEIIGLLCEWDGASSFNADQWVNVTGTIGKLPHLNSGKIQEIPYIKVEKVDPVEKPAIPYLYTE